MKQYDPYLQFIDSQANKMQSTLQEWVDINSSSDNISGLELMLQNLKKEFSSLQAEQIEIPLLPITTIANDGSAIVNPLGKIFSLRKRPNAPLQILLAGHMDTVYPNTPLNQNPCVIANGLLKGPGGADMKGGLIVMLYALLALEKSPFANEIGWSVIINPDEEIGSPGSTPYYQKAAAEHHLGLIFEPTLEDDSYVIERGGSANYSFIAKGRCSHAGRAFHDGRSAIHGLSHFITDITEQTKLLKHAHINVGYIYGGGPINVVADHALCKVNIRAHSLELFEHLENIMDESIKKINATHEICIQKIRHSLRYPKSNDTKTKLLFSKIKECASLLGEEIEGKYSGGVSDGNTLSHFGLANIDTMGVRGGRIHSPDEFMVLKSLTEKASLCALFLMKLATKEIVI